MKKFIKQDEKEKRLCPLYGMGRKGTNPGGFVASNIAGGTITPGISRRVKELRVGGDSLRRANRYTDLYVYAV